MKKIITAIALIVVFNACKSDKSQPQTIVLVQDTSQLYNNTTLTDKASDDQAYGVAAGSALQGMPVKTQQKPVSSTSTKPVAQTNSANNNSSSSVASSNTVPAKKKGWSHKAKGVAVGAGTGAITGALINKNNRGVGAIVGGLVGAASGYIIGNEVDKKKEKERP